MASSMQLSERRWTSTRKSGMTVLGKVPKPINLPSQKLENHGLDPNVEIVPKGTLTWGTRPLLAASSAWGSSTLSSPRTDGSVGSPIHANGRPLSGGSGTRPSTGSSERSSEPVAISWGPSSRPSSASGILPSNHMSVAANRPRSAETRPNSSHLSRFAENSADSIAWGAAGTSEKVAAEVSKRSHFTLSSGDFPTLGSEKCDEPKSQGQNPKVPAPASGLSSSLKGTPEYLLTSGDGNPDLALHGNFNSWNADTHPHAGEGPSTRTENWHRDNHNAQLLLDANMPARQYGSWHGPPAHHSNVVWYGGHEAGGLYRPSFGPPGSYHVDPYYPYVPAGALPNTQAFPRAEAIPGGVHLQKGEAYRHMPPESYIGHSQSGIPVRPGVYTGPVQHEGCYGPTGTSFDNSPEQDGSTLGMPGLYGVHNQHLSENPRLQPWRFHAQPDGSSSVSTNQHVISCQSNETQGHYKVLLKQHGSLEEKDTSGKEHTVTVWPTAQRGRQPGFSTPEADLMDHSYKQEQATEEQHGEISHSQRSNDLVDHNNRNSSGISKPAGHNVTKKLDTAAVHISGQQNAIVKKNASLMEKVECLNSKTRVVDVRFEGEDVSTKEMRSNQNSSSDEGHFEVGDLANSWSSSNTPISGTRNVSESQLNTSTKVIMHESVLELKPTPHQSDEPVIVPGKSNSSEDGGHLQSHYQKRVRNAKGKVDHHGKLKFGSYGAADTNNTLERDSLEKINVTNAKSGYLLSTPGSHASQVVPEDQGSHLIFNSVSDRSSLKSVDHDAQHAKQKELARQRAIELQKEEEERTAEQKAKALAKLAELNKRASASSKQNSRQAQLPCNNIPNKHDTSGKDEKATTVSETLHDGSPCDFQVKKHPYDGNIIKLGDPADLSFTQPSGTSDSSLQANVSVVEQQGSNPEITTARSALDLHDNNVSRRKQAGYRRRRNITDERNQPEKLTNSESSGNTRCASMVTEAASDGLGILNSDPPVQASRNNRGPKYKNKLSDTQLNSSLPRSTHLEGEYRKIDLDSDETKSSANLSEPLSVGENNSNEIMRGQNSIDLIVEPNHAGFELTKLTTERTSNNWKPQPHRKPARNLQFDKANAKYQGSETVVWAPVKVVNKDGSSEVHKSSASEITNLPDGKNVQDMQNGAKARRAEIERYVPKPIAKELYLQGDSHQSSPPVAPASTAEKAGKRELASSSSVTPRDVNSTVSKTALNSMNAEDTKQSRYGKTHPSWRQRNSGESSHEQSVLEGSLPSVPSKSVEITSELQHSRISDDLHVEGGNNLQDEPMTTSGIVKDHGVTRQRRQHSKEVRADGSTHAPSPSKVLQGEVPNKKETHPPAPVDSAERNPARNENQNAGSAHMKSHWQPKSQVHSQHYPHGYKSSGGQRATEKLLPSQTIEKSNEVDDMKYQEGFRDIKVMNQPSKDQNQSIDSSTESASTNANTYKEYRQNRGHFPRGGDATYGGGKKAHPTRNVEQHFEYQTGYNKDDDLFQKNSSASEEASEAHRVSSGSRYGGQGRNHYRRGSQFYGPRRGT